MIIKFEADASDHQIGGGREGYREIVDRFLETLAGIHIGGQYVIDYDLHQRSRYQFDGTIRTKSSPYTHQVRTISTREKKFQKSGKG